MLRNSARLEALYAQAAARAFKFCITHKRATEFRRLCDILRNHLSNLIRYRDQASRDRTDLSIPASWEMYLDTRFEQLRSACELELWAEAFRSVEDIQVRAVLLCCAVLRGLCGGAACVPGSLAVWKRLCTGLQRVGGSSRAGRLTC